MWLRSETSIIYRTRKGNHSQLLSNLVGGGTAFPKIGVVARHSKGSAVFWYNLHRDGGRDNLSLHGACPVVMGVKWVSNKWIREGEQVWRRPCQ